MITQQQTNAAISVLRACLETIREIPEGIPSGHLYAAMMAKGFDLPTYEAIERTMIGTGLVEKSNHLLTWKGPR